MVVLYHYTDMEGKIGIQLSNTIEARHPHGNTRRRKAVFLTALPPTTNKEELLRNNYDIAKGEYHFYRERGLKKLEYHFKIDSRKLPGISQNMEAWRNDRRNEWLYYGDIKLENEVNVEASDIVAVVGAVIIAGAVLAKNDSCSLM